MALSNWVVSYDIESDRTRRRVATMLEARGPRVLYSVFEVAATEDDAEALFQRAGRLLGQDDRLLLLPACEQCRRVSLGRGIEPAPEQMIIAGVDGDTP